MDVIHKTSLAQSEREDQDNKSHLQLLAIYAELKDFSKKGFEVLFFAFANPYCDRWQLHRLSKMRGYNIFSTTFEIHLNLAVNKNLFATKIPKNGSAISRNKEYFPLEEKKEYLEYALFNIQDKLKNGFSYKESLEALILELRDDEKLDSVKEYKKVARHQLIGTYFEPGKLANIVTEALRSKFPTLNDSGIDLASKVMICHLCHEIDDISSTIIRQKTYLSNVQVNRYLRTLEDLKLVTRRREKNNKLTQVTTKFLSILPREMFQLPGYIVGASKEEDVSTPNKTLTTEEVPELNIRNENSTLENNSSPKKSPDPKIIDRISELLEELRESVAQRESEEEDSRNYKQQLECAEEKIRSLTTQLQERDNALAIIGRQISQFSK